jgi:hypothetical protein
MKKISYSQYNMWSNCGHAWKLRYIDGHKLDDGSIHTAFGTACHVTIQDWLNILYNESEVKAKTIFLHDTFKAHLLEEFKKGTKEVDGEKVFYCDKKTLMEFYEQGCKILDYVQQNYKKIFPTTHTKLFAIEYPLDMEVKPNVHYIGYIDIVTHNTLTDKYVLYDLKTSRTGWTDSQKKDINKVGQLLLYKRFFAQQLMLDEDQISVEFVILKRTIMENASFPIPRVSKFEPPNKKPSLNKMWVEFDKFLNEAFDESGNYIEDQKPNPSKENCRWCVFLTRKDLCSHGVKK